MTATFRDLLARLDDEADVVEAIALSRRLADAAAAADPTEVVPLLRDRLAGDDLGALAAVEALARVPDDAADQLLTELVDDPRPAVGQHAVWRLADRLPARHLYGRLVGRIAAGGFGAMLAQATLASWARVDPVGTSAVLDGALARFAAAVGLGSASSDRRRGTPVDLATLPAAERKTPSDAASKRTVCVGKTRSNETP